ncbi:hypothetical protein LTR55_011442 [Exophiala xenobiotica]|nr:hypothetical protein LTR14_011939 [Exophiala xenobiotica]KAK5469020.1 hypothetical protein LTR55_011442 [Exophiala xenobiotica]
MAKWCSSSSIVEQMSMNAQGGYFGNALQAASSGGHEEVVQILIDRGAGVNAQGGEYGNALYAASSGGREEVVQMLIDRGAEVHGLDDQFEDLFTQLQHKATEIWA